MANETRYFKTPFAESGTRTEVPNTSVGGAVGFDTGFGSDYELPQGSAGRKRIERDKYNGLHHSITKNLKQWQEKLYPTWIEDNGSGVPFSYPQGMIVNHSGQDWISNEAANQEEPGTGNKWSVYFLAKFEHYGTTETLAGGKHPVGEYVTVKDRALGVFLVQSGGVANGIGILDAGNGNTAEIQSTTEIDFAAFGLVYGSVAYQDEVYEYAMQWNNTNRKSKLIVSGIINLNETHMLPEFYNVSGLGASVSKLLAPELGAGTFINSGATDSVGCTLEKLTIAATNINAVTVAMFKKIKQGSRISDLVINGGLNGAVIEESWVSCFDEVYIREGGMYGITIRSPDSNNQVNAINIDGIFVQGYQHNWYFDGVSGGGRALYIPHGSSELSRKTSMIIDGFGGVTCGAGFYYEGNYTDAVGASGEILDKTKPVDVLIKRTGGVFDAVHSFDKSYFARRNDFNAPTQVVGVYIDPSCPAYVIESNVTTNVCNTTGYVDFDIYNDSPTALVEMVKGKSNSEYPYYGRVVQEVVASDVIAQTGFTSTWEGLANVVIPVFSVYDYYLSYEVTAGGTTTSSFLIQIINPVTLVVLQTLTIPTGAYSVGDKLLFRINGQTLSTVLKTPSPATGGNVTGLATVFKAKIGSAGSYAVGPVSNINLP